MSNPNDFSTSAPTGGSACWQCGQMRWAGLVHECPTGLPVRQYFPTQQSDLEAEIQRLTEELRAVREERDKLQLAIEISARPIQYFMDLKAERDTLYKELELRAMLHGDCQEANEKLLADLAAEKRHWVEDDRDLNALTEEQDALQKRNEKLETALKQYADPNSWHTTSLFKKRVWMGYGEHYGSQGPDLAKAALGLGEGKEKA